MFFDASQFGRKNSSAFRPDVVQFLRTASTFLHVVLGTAVNLEPELVTKTCTQMENRSSFGTLFSAPLHPIVNQAPLVFHDSSMLHQCRYSCLLEATQVRRQGFAHRRTLQAFTTWYAELLQRKRRRAAVDDMEACARISKQLVVRRCSSERPRWRS